MSGQAMKLLKLKLKRTMLTVFGTIRKHFAWTATDILRGTTHVACFRID